MMRATRNVAAAVCVAVAGMAMTAGSALATYPGINGKIFFNSDADVFSMNPDGGGQTNLTSGGTDSSTQPSVSANGSTVAFASNRGGNFDIWVMDADGANPHRVTDTDDSDTQPTLSPDGSLIIFKRVLTSNDPPDLWSVPAAGGTATNLTNTPVINEIQPTFSPNGATVAYSRAPAASSYKIWTMSSNGSNQAALPNPSASGEEDADYSPDGTKIVYKSTSSSNVVVMNADGSNRAPLDVGAAPEGAGTPAFSPDGAMLAFGRDTTVGAPFRYDEIFTAAVNGSSPVNRTNNGSVQIDESPAWAVKYTKPVVTPPDTAAPETIQGKGPKKKIQKRTAKFHFTSEAGATFRCVLDDKPDVPCTDPFTAKKLKKGKHVVLAAAVDAAGNTDATPARWKFKVTK